VTRGLRGAAKGQGSETELQQAPNQVELLACNAQRIYRLLGKGVGLIEIALGQRVRGEAPQEKPRASGVWLALMVRQAGAVVLLGLVCVALILGGQAQVEE
jgi:hypothetical protein